MTTAYRRISESVEDLLAKSHYMVAKCQVDGNLTFDGHSKTVEEVDNESRCRSLCQHIERVLAECAPEEITGLLEMYELLHRIGYASQPSQNTVSALDQSFEPVGLLQSHMAEREMKSFMAEQRKRVYTAWRSGNRNIQESQIYPLLKKSLNGRPFAKKMLKNWVKTLLKHNRFPNVTTHENYQRLALIMRENIDKELKREWYEANRVGNLSTLSTPLLKSYRSFVASLFPSVLTREDRQELFDVVLSEVCSRSDVEYYDLKAIILNLDCVPN